MSFTPDDRHPLTPVRLVLAVAFSFLASIAALVIAILILVVFILSGARGMALSLGTTVHPRNVVASSSRSRPVRTTPGGTAHLEISPRPDDRGEGALPPAPGPRPDFPRLPGGVA